MVEVIPTVFFFICAVSVKLKDLPYPITIVQDRLEHLSIEDIVFFQHFSPGFCDNFPLLWRKLNGDFGTFARIERAHIRARIKLAKANAESPFENVLLGGTRWPSVSNLFLASPPSEKPLLFHKIFLGSQI